MRFWSTYVNQENKGFIIQPQNINKAPVTHHSLLVSRIKQSFTNRISLEEAFYSLAKNETINIYFFFLQKPINTK